MTEEEAKSWVKDKTNQDKVVRQFFKDNKPMKSKIAFFMAGIPGAVKQSLLITLSKKTRLSLFQLSMINLLSI
jgi:hypothetical protein